MSEDDKVNPDGSANDELASPSAEVNLNLETGVIAWKELLPHFARGVVIKVLEGRDLIEVGDAMSRDDTEQIQKWLEDQSVARASDDDARDWVAREPEFWCVVTAPWVLVQEFSEKSTVH